MISYLLVITGAFFAGLIQSVTGFGSAIVQMMFYPYVFPVFECTSINVVTSVPMTIRQSIRYRHHIQWKLVVAPFIGYVITASIAMQISSKIQGGIMLKVLGVFLVMLSLYFLLIAKNLKVKPSMASATICGCIAGVTGGLFGVGGPPMVLYYLGATSQKEEYLGTIQFYFVLTGVYNLLFRLFMGVYYAKMIPFICCSVIAVLIGEKVGSSIVSKIDEEKMRRLVYIILLFSGLVNIF